MNKTLVLALATALGVAGLQSTAGVARADNLKIAIAGPITGSDAAIGEQMRRGGAQAVADINAKGGVLGKQLTLDVGDDACDPKQAVAVANKFAVSGIVFVAGHYCSSTSIPASAVYADAGILEISPASTNPAYTDDAAKKGWVNVYRVCGRDDVQGKVAGEYIADHFKGKPVAIIDDKTTYGKGLADETRKALNAKGVKEAIDDEINQGDKDFSALVSKMKQANAGVIYFGGYYTEAGLIVRQASDQGLKATLIGGDALVTTEFWTITGNAGAGTLMTFSPDPRKVPAAQPVVAEFKTQNYDPEGYTLYTYAAVQIFAQAANQAKSTDIDKTSKVMHSAQFDTVLGQVGFDEKGDIKGPGYVMFEWQNGKYEQTGEAMQPGK
ncbi:MAG TPA: branched-chain amino acid ABC transporter substrate-binding protein [Stellaceae bacterium]|jgi:branched-chain amino acid transport system substrate-binding protein|nr:branched-chain amino acid ABC transporter substrate-binding protein [Stellaceae bacterium]